MGAQGLLPLAPPDLTELWCFLVRDSDEAVAQAAMDAGISGAFSYPGTPATAACSRKTSRCTRWVRSRKSG